jgi:hypothetical protein
MSLPWGTEWQLNGVDPQTATSLYLITSACVPSPFSPYLLLASLRLLSVLKALHYPYHRACKSSFFTRHGVTLRLSNITPTSCNGAPVEKTGQACAGLGGIGYKSYGPVSECLPRYYFQNVTIVGNCYGIP